jgi:YD repeat-containing protein
LNRVYSVTYNTAATTSQPTPSVAITYGLTALKLGIVEEAKQIDSFNNNPWKETYQYDDLSRTSSKTISFDNQAQSYTTSYSYNQISQLSRVTYLLADLWASHMIQGEGSPASLALALISTA